MATATNSGVTAQALQMWHFWQMLALQLPAGAPHLHETNSSCWLLLAGLPSISEKELFSRAWAGHQQQGHTQHPQ
jgi:cbb3-type cytochrome oxidase subunit 1